MFFISAKLVTSSSQSIMVQISFSKIGACALWPTRCKSETTVAGAAPRMGTGSWRMQSGPAPWALNGVKICYASAKTAVRRCTPVTDRIDRTASLELSIRSSLVHRSPSGTSFTQSRKKRTSCRYMALSITAQKSKVATQRWQYGNAKTRDEFPKWLQWNIVS